MEISILSLNVHIWIKDLNPFNWKKFFIPRTVKMGKLFKRYKAFEKRAKEILKEILDDNIVFLDSSL